jgi:hypothetical protein
VNNGPCIAKVSYWLPLEKFHMPNYGSGFKKIIFSFFDQLDRILTPGYTPNVMDILYTRSPTSGVYEISFGFQDFTIRLAFLREALKDL